MIFATAIVFISALVVFAADFNVIVGANNQLVFNPTSVTGVQNGDTVHFEFVSKNHSVTQSSFASPCTRADGGIDSGFLSVSDPNVHPVWSFKVNSASAPFWFYCAQKSPVNHCQMGMIFAVNPTADKSYDAFLAAAKNSANGTTGDPPAQTFPSIPLSGDAPAVTNSGISSSAGPDISAPLGSGFSTSIAAATGTISSATSDQDANHAIVARGGDTTSVVTVASILVAMAGFVI